MAELILQLRTNPVTGQREITVKLDSDRDLLPSEHEALHRKIVDQLAIHLGEDLQDASLIIEREPVSGTSEPLKGTADEEDSRQGNPN